MIFTGPICLGKDHFHVEEEDDSVVTKHPSGEMTGKRLVGLCLQ